ncbi:hypothetical protein HPB52_003163 [Rhipicephalus sanguineus]|uniref:DUF4097 domain-containing protein n=1 Tax=Rhipicephalus sanguineus TaxID=34632 RepID=A0A9D4T4S6_RHISA|nr:hypothetical protein HPB52_003163 [Rhipicephalus sanguineus]
MSVAKSLNVQLRRTCCRWWLRSASDDAKKVVLDERRRSRQALLRVRLPCSAAISAVDDGSAVVTATLMGARPFLGCESPIALSLDGAALTVTGVDGTVADLLCRLRVPFMTSIDVELSGCAQATLENLVLDQCTVRTEGQGDIALSNVKANAVVLTVEDGSITAKGAVQGNLEVTSQGSGGFKAQRLLANHLKVKTLAGQQHLSAVYAEKARLESTEGIIDIGTLHSQDAVLTSQSGAILLGNVTLSLSAPCKVTVDAPVKKSDFDGLSEGDVHSATESQITAKSCSGSVIVKKQDWISSLNLGGRST